MKTASPALAALITSGNFTSYDLYTIATSGGETVRLTTCDVDLYDNSGNRFHSGGYGTGYPRIDPKGSRSRGHWKRGLDSDQWTVTIAAAVIDPASGLYTYPDTLGSTPWLAACRAGLFDNAYVTVQRAYFAAPPILPLTVAGRTAVGTLTIFYGYVSNVDLTQTASVFTITDFLGLMTMQMPRNLYQSSCRNLLFDVGCMLSAAGYAKTGVALAGSTQAVIQATPPAFPGYSSNTWQLGRLAFTSGNNNGISRMVAGWSSGSTAFSMQYMFPFSIAAGDTFNIWPGCDKQLSTCGQFNNTANFRGEPFVPVPETTMG